mgnify:CR=1 FL=1
MSQGFTDSVIPITLTTEVTGTLPVANGGTGVATVASNNLLTGNGTSALVAESTLTYDGTTLTLGSGQIAFPATQAASSGANTLDDYEEGTWTPVIGGAGGTSGQTYAVQTGTYIKTGKQVVVWFRTEFSAKGTITGALQLQGLPFTIEDVVSQRAFMPFWYEALAVNWILVGAILVPNTTAPSFYGSSAAGTSLATLATADVGNATGFTGSLSYRATA